MSAVGCAGARLSATALGALWCILSHVASAASPDLLIEQGRRLYRDGVLHSGEILQARVAGGATLAAQQAACQNCHRRSGLGTSEGGRVVPSIAGETLFRPRQSDRPLGVTTTPSAAGARPAYRSASLARALRDGVDPAGRALSELMPRYDLDAPTLEALSRYIRTLSARNPAGVTAQEMHLATIITPDVPLSERRAVVDVMEAAIRDHNAEIRRETKRGERPVMGHSRAYRAFRKWRLHVWELHGPSDTWSGQLDSALQAQPVFAVVSGVGRGNWQPIHDFCEHREVPCLFPGTDRPPAETAFYSLYLSRGIALEADIVAHEIAQAGKGGDRKVVQVYLDNDEGRARAQELRRSLALVPSVRLFDRPLPVVAPAPVLSRGMWVNGGQADLVFWLGRTELATLRTGDRLQHDIGAIYLSSSLLGGPDGVPTALRPSARLVHPYDLPDRWLPRRAQLEQWLRGHHLTLTEERVQANTYLAMNLFAKALKHVREPFSRDYLVERIEHATENSAWRSVYRELSLGANAQRFASKGGYVITWTGVEALQLDGRWVVPGIGASSLPALTRIDYD